MQHAVPLKRWRSTIPGVNCGRIPPPRRRIEGKEHDRLISGALAGLAALLLGMEVEVQLSGQRLIGLSVRKGGHSFYWTRNAIRVRSSIQEMRPAVGRCREACFLR
jgi:hypothetical protein